MNKKQIIAVIISVAILASLGIWYGRTKKIAPPQQNVQNNSQTNNQTSDQNPTVITKLKNVAKESYGVKLDYKPIEFKKEVAPYSVKSDLSNVENISQFGNFTALQQDLLSKNCFFAGRTKQQQLFYIYENNEYLKIPSFITADSVLQVYHMFFDFSLRTVEKEKLIPILEELTNSMLLKSVDQMNKAQDEAIKAAALKNVAFFGVAQKLLGKQVQPNLPQNALKMIDKECVLIENAVGKSESNIFPFKLDYSQYKPRGHYTRDDAFKRYFKAMMWYGQVGLPAKTEYKEQIYESLLMTSAVFSEQKTLDDWQKIYEPTAFYVGSTDDLNIHDFKDLMTKVYGDIPDVEALNNDGKIDQLLNLIKNLPAPRIDPQYADPKMVTGKNFRFMGQRYIPDSEILQKLSGQQRLMPKGLDVMGVFGSDRAYDILLNQYKENEKWPEYPDKFKKLRDTFSSLSDDTWRSNLYFGWLWSLKSLISPYDKGYPSFMTNTAWQDKSLSSALGSWSELRHDTILYAKGSAAECGDGQEPPVVKGYIEPNVEFYQRLLWLTQYSRESLSAKQILSGKLQDNMKRFEDLLNFLIRCSIKELKNEELTKEEYDSIRIYGGHLENLTVSVVEDAYKWFQITDETDKNMAVIADVHTALAQYLEEGVGYASEIYVVVPIGGKLYLTRGAVFSYYEFPNNTRLTDEEWQNMLKQDSQPPQPEWTKSFMGEDKQEIPVPTEPYSSGC